MEGPAELPAQADLVRRAAAGDEEAFADLFEPLGLRLKMFIRGRGGDLLGGDCSEEDVLQIVLARIWGLLGEFEYRGPAAFYGWVITITEHALSDRAKYLKAKGRREVKRLDTGVLRSLPPQVRRMATSISSRAARHEEVVRLSRAIDGLEPDLRAVIERQVVGTESLAETAEALGISKTTAWNRVQRGLEALREVLDPPG